ncbi:MAG: zinc ribbon domain-containing protein, partial [Deltaproteobacteria bacterium]|nr:zinc ribbon domain-containing protein [Deltaproteobacteria bacterium]
IENDLLEFLRAFLADKEHPSALELLFDNKLFGDQERKNLIEQAMRLAKNWVKWQPTGRGHILPITPVAGQRPCYIGVEDTEHNAALRQQFMDVVNSFVGAGDTIPTPVDIGAGHRESIIFYNEIAGIPAFYPASVTGAQGLRDCYNKFYGRNQDDEENSEELHTHKNRCKFQDIVPKDDRQAHHYRLSVNSFVLARLLGLLKIRMIRKDGPNPIFHYSYEVSDGINYNEISLGDELTAIDTLYRDQRPDHQSHRLILANMVEETICDLQRKKLLPVYLLLIEFYMTQIYPVQTYLSDIGREITRFTSELATLVQERYRVADTLLVTAPEKEQVTSAFLKLRGKPVNQTLIYEEYRTALKAYTRPDGQFRVTDTLVGRATRASWLDALVLDLSIQDAARRAEAGPVSIAPPTATAATAMEGRQCPACGKEINIRAIYCTHCQKTVAKHVPCAFCGEPKVPDDLLRCWNCGRGIVKEEEIECQQCFAFKGLKSKFPCEVCGWHWDDSLKPEPQPGPEADSSYDRPQAADVPPEPRPEPKPDPEPRPRPEREARPTPGAAPEPPQPQPGSRREDPGPAAASSGPPPGQEAPGMSRKQVTCPHCQAPATPPICDSCGGDVA